MDPHFYIKAKYSLPTQLQVPLVLSMMCDSYLCLPILLRGIFNWWKCCVLPLNLKAIQKLLSTYRFQNLALKNTWCTSPPWCTLSFQTTTTLLLITINLFELSAPHSFEIIQTLATMLCCSDFTFVCTYGAVFGPFREAFEVPHLPPTSSCYRVLWNKWWMNLSSEEAS